MDVFISFGRRRKWFVILIERELMIMVSGNLMSEQMVNGFLSCILDY